MEAMFAAVTDLYARHWNDFFHFALFENDDQSWEAAYEATHERYLDALRVDRAERILEVGCGRGGFAELLAARTNAEVVGVDVSRAQLARAANRRRPNLRFEHRDVMSLDEEDGKFDAVASIDAACYFPRKRAAIEKLGTVANPGARLLLVDWCKRDGLNRIQEELVLEPFMRCWAIPNLETGSNYGRHLEAAGFEVLEIADFTAKVRRDWDFGYERALKAVSELSYDEAARLLWSVRRVGRRAATLLKDQFPAALYIKAAYDAGFLRYTYVLGEKRSAGSLAE